MPRFLGTFIIGSGTASGTGTATDSNGNACKLLFPGGMAFTRADQVPQKAPYRVPSPVGFRKPLREHSGRIRSIHEVSAVGYVTGSA
jgi:hypothetical protein